MAQPHPLAVALDFTADDLYANRAGQLSQRQGARMSGYRRNGRAGTVVVSLVAVAFVVAIVLFELPSLRKQSAASSAAGDSVPIVPLVVGVLILVVLIMTFSLVRTRRSLNRLVGPVEFIDGVVTTRVHRMPGNVTDVGVDYGGGLRYEVTVDRTMFIVANGSVLAAFDDGRYYRAYFTGSGFMKSLLSAEPLQ